MTKSLMDIPARYPKLREFLEQALWKWRAREGGYLGTIRDFAGACGIHEVAMGRYIAGLQQPSPESQDKIANVTGVGIYEACNAPLRVPKDKQLERFLVADWPDIYTTTISKYPIDILIIACYNCRVRQI